MELCDVVDRNGNPTGKVIQRDGELKPGEYDLGVHMYIVNSEGKFLIQKRAKCKRHYPDIWELNMGNVISGETSKEAAIREVLEEIGIKVKEDELELANRFVWERYSHIVDVWVIHKDVDISLTKLREEEVSEVKYVSKEELIELLQDQSSNRPWRPDEYIEAIKGL